MEVWEYIEQFINVNRTRIQIIRCAVGGSNNNFAERNVRFTTNYKYKYIHCCKIFI